MTNERYQTVTNDYVNTGGHIMVNITTVYDKQENKMLFIYINEEQLVVTNYDYIRNELPEDIPTEVFIQYRISRDDFTTDPSPSNTDMLDIPEVLADVMFYCLQQYIINYTNDTKQHVFMTVNQLPDSLYRQLSDNYIKWLNENDQLVETDGNRIYISADYNLTLEYTDNGKEAVKLQTALENWMPVDNDDNDEWEKFYNGTIQIIANNQLFTFYNSADIYNALINAAKEVIDEQ